jgi:LemA protein
MNIVKAFLAFLIPYLLFTASGCGYNTLQQRDEKVKAAWSNVLNQYQKRVDLVANLVTTVQASAGHERDTLTAVIEARAKATSVQVTPELANNAEALVKFQQAQGGLTQALSRLMVVSERYPDLKANANFLQLQADVKDIEKSIAFARKKYIEEVQGYNVTVRSFPVNLTAKMFGMAVKPNFSVENENEINKAPKIDFSRK